MRFALATIGLASAVSCFACGKDEPSSAPKATAAPSAPVAVEPPPPLPSASVSAPPLPKCPEGLTGNALPAFCIKLPPGYTVKEARVTPTRGAIDYATGAPTDLLTVTYDGTSIAELSKDVESEMKFGHDKLEKKGPLPGGNKWFQGSHAEYARIVTLIKGQPPPMTLKCSFAYQPKKPPPKLAIDACKSIVVP